MAATEPADFPPTTSTEYIGMFCFATGRFEDLTF
jgi:hypothetical protein